MISSVMVVPGLDPLRTVRIAYAFAPRHVILPVTRSARFGAEHIEAALVELGMTPPRIHLLEVDEWDLGSIRARLAEGVDDLATRHDLGGVAAVIGGGTKPMVAAVAAYAEERNLATWVMDDYAGALVTISGESLPIPEPPTNLEPAVLSRLYSVHRAIRQDPLVDNQTLLRWLKQTLRAGGAGRGDVHSQAETFEQAVVSLIRALLTRAGDDFGVWPPMEFVLRDPHEPTRPALDPPDMHDERMFELDGVVIRGTRSWVIETKYIGKKRMTQTLLRTHLAELDRRRRDVGGQTCTGVLVTLDDEMADRFPEGPQPFQPAGVEIITRSDLLDALVALDAGDEARMRQTELARVFLG